MSAIVNERDTFTAATTVALPTCDATMVQVPAVSTVMVLLATVQTLAVEEAYETGSAADDDAVITGDASPNVIVDLLSVKLIVWPVFTANV